MVCIVCGIKEGEKKMTFNQIGFLVIAVATLLISVWGVCTFAADYMNEKNNFVWQKRIKTVALWSAFLGLLLFAFLFISACVFAAFGKV